ncbi:MAG: hydroxyacid dehydrogenase [Bacteroidia bacterium]|nr:hydroxyacid dehydrogenase [Bacteroidia bacterium]
MKKRVLVTDLVHDFLIESFEKAGYTVDFIPDITLSESESIIHQYHGAIINSKIKANQQWITKGNQLEFIGRLGSGMEIIDVDFARSRSIRVYSAPEGNRNAVAEHALGMLLSLANKLRIGDTMVRTLQWNREAARGFEIEGKTIGIIGFGNNGSRFAQKLAGMEMQVLAHDKYLKDYTADFNHVTEAGVEDIQKHCDIISLHLPLTQETYHYFDGTFLSKCQKKVILINTARGKNIHTPTLLKGLQNGSILGACLDVFENEKPESYSKEEEVLYDALFARDNVILSPHVAGWTMESKYKIAKTLVDKILK